MTKASELRHVSPSESIAHSSLLSAAERAGHDRLTVRHLFWLINAHPQLVAHALVFQHLGAILDLIKSGRVGPVDDWGVEIPQWIDFCHWVDRESPSLAKLPGLDRIALREKGSTGHPLLGEGVWRHGVVTAMWSSHESLGRNDRYPPPQSVEKATQYFYLQSHLLRGYIEGRWKHSSLEFYERYSEDKERPITPAASGAPSLAVRELSRSRYSGLLSALDPSLPAEQFNARIIQMKPDWPVLRLEQQRVATRSFLALQRYFRGVARVMAGGKPKQKTRQGQSGHSRKGSKWRAGFIPARAQGVFFQPRAELHGGPDFGATTEVSVWINAESDPVNELSSVEKSGLAPAEVLEHVFDLVEAESYGASIQAARFKRQAIEAQAQHAPWAVHNLTLGEQESVWCWLQAAICVPKAPPKNVSLARYRLIVGLVLKCVFLLGQPLERVRQMRVVWLDRDEAFDPFLPPEIGYLTLYCRRHEADSGVISLGFGLPAITPDYATELEDELIELSHPNALGIILPDPSNLGCELAAFLKNESREDDRVFGIEAEKLNKEVSAFLKGTTKSQRITHHKIQRVLPLEILKQTGDQVLAWLITADADSRNEPRMFYARKRLRDIRSAYANAVTAILCRMGYRPAVFAEIDSSVEAQSVGCRFTLRSPDLTSVCSGLKEQLLNSKREPGSLTEIIEYNNQFHFYSYIYQSVATSVRAITQPVGLIADWINSGCPNKPCRTGIADKSTKYFENARLVEIISDLGAQYHHLGVHIQSLVNRLNIRRSWNELPLEERLMVIVEKDLTLHPVHPAWIEEQFCNYLPVAVPANFHRAYLRFELENRGVPPQIVDAFLGHANVGEQPFSVYSTFHYGNALDVLLPALGDILDELGLTPIESRLAPYPARLAQR